jgi:hypothetical protein
LLLIGVYIIKPLFFYFSSSFVLMSLVAIMVISAFIMIYYGMKKDKRESLVITLVKKEHITKPSGEGDDFHFYYFYTDTNREYTGCERLYNFLQGNETVEVIVEDNTICGLVKVIDINVGGSGHPLTKEVS